MTPGTITLITVIAIIVIAGVGWILFRKRRSEHLRSRFGPEYDRVVQERGNQWRAESVLETREKRVEQLHLRALSPQEREHFAEAWQADQARFVDDPKDAITEADRLVTEVMKARGYPMSDFEQRAQDISVDHPRVVQNYRAAAEIMQRHNGGEATTEDLRMAMVYYRALLEDLLEIREMRRKTA